MWLWQHNHKSTLSKDKEAPGARRSQQRKKAEMDLIMELSEWLQPSQSLEEFTHIDLLIKDEKL